MPFFSLFKHKMIEPGLLQTILSSHFLFDLNVGDLLNIRETCWHYRLSIPLHVLHQGQVIHQSKNRLKWKDACDTYQSRNGLLDGWQNKRGKQQLWKRGRIVRDDWSAYRNGVRHGPSAVKERRWKGSNSRTRNTGSFMRLKGSQRTGDKYQSWTPGRDWTDCRGFYSEEFVNGRVVRTTRFYWRLFRKNNTTHHPPQPNVRSRKSTQRQLKERISEAYELLD